MNKLQIKTMKAISTGLIFVFLLAGCATTSSSSAVSYRRGAEGDMCLSKHAATYIDLFLADYPDMQVTKVRWQVLHNNLETYIIEGNNGKEKNIVKYLCENQMILGRTERQLLDEELEKGKPIEKPLQFETLLTYTELCDIALQELGGQLQELRVVQKGERAVAYAETRDEYLCPSGLLINAQTGEII